MSLRKRAQGKTCEAINGIFEEGEEIIEEYKGSEAPDAGWLAGGQAVEHYAMSRYGALKNWATQLGVKDAADLLDETLEEKKRPTRRLRNWRRRGSIARPPEGATAITKSRSTDALRFFYAEARC